MVPSFVHYLEVLEGTDGDKMPGTNNISNMYLYVGLEYPECNGNSVVFNYRYLYIWFFCDIQRYLIIW